MPLQTTFDDEFTRLIHSLMECVNAQFPRLLADAYAPFQWAIEASKVRKAELQHRVDFHADDPLEQSKNLKLAQSARSAARGILWWLATVNDAALDEPVLFKPGHRHKVRWAGLKSDAPLLEAPMIFRHFKVERDSVTERDVAIWDRPSTCIGHALDLLLTNYRGLRGRVRACPFLKRGALSEWNAEQIGRDHVLHFFVDDRFEKGQAQLYCTPKHRQTAYMRKYRRDLATARHK
jgi:hypothetical protein